MDSGRLDERVEEIQLVDQLPEVPQPVAGLLGDACSHKLEDESREDGTNRLAARLGGGAVVVVLDVLEG